MIDEAQRAFATARRTATLATLSGSGQARLLPICFVLDESADGMVRLYSPLDDKPKRGDIRELARIRDITRRPDVSLLFERWDEDWTRLAWLRAHGRATLQEWEEDAATHQRVVVALRAKYPQYRTHALEGRPLIVVTLAAVTAWSAAGGLAGEEGFEPSIP